MEQLETDRLIIKEVSEADIETILPVYIGSADYLDTQTPDEPSSAMVRSDLAQAAEYSGVYCGIFRRETNEPIGVISSCRTVFAGSAIMRGWHRS